MTHLEGSFLDARGVQIYHQSWQPESQPRAALLLVHGLAEHGGRYMNVVNHFVPRGYAVYAVDHMGHGKSGGARVHVNGFQEYIDTLKRYFDLVRANHANRRNQPIFLVGHSMGGLIASLYLLEHQAGLAGVVLSAPAIVPPGNNPVALQTLVKALSAALPRMRVLGLDARNISRDSDVVQAYIDDPLVYTGKSTARLAGELLSSMDRARAGAHSITLPILIVQGSADRLVGPAGAQILYETVGSTDKTLRIYDGFFHELFNEPQRGQVLGDVESWLEAHLPD